MIECVQIYVLHLFLDIFFLLSVAVESSLLQSYSPYLDEGGSTEAFGLHWTGSIQTVSTRVTGCHRKDPPDSSSKDFFQETAIDDGNVIVTIDRELMMMMMMMMMM